MPPPVPPFDAGLGNDEGRPAASLAVEMGRLGLRLIGATTGLASGGTAKPVAQTENLVQVGHQAVITDGSGFGNVTFPVAFPEAVRTVIAWGQYGGFMKWWAVTKTGFTFQASASATNIVNWVAVGY